MKKILLLGSGELGKEFVISAQRKGQHVIACDSYAGAPAMQVADEFEVFDMLDGEALERVVEKHHPDIIVPEIEAIRTERLYDFEKEGIQVVPSARAVNFTMNRKAIRDLAAKELGLKTANYFYAKTLDELKEAAAKIGFPCVVKPLMSSSGKGQSLVKSADELEHAWEYGCSGSRGDIRELIIEEFIKKLNEIILSNLSNQEFSMDDMAESLNMSRSSFYRKMKGVLDLSPNEYLRIERLKRAAQLLKEGESRINEICYMVGFSSSSYFSKCFLKQFGVLPKDFAG